MLALMMLMGAAAAAAPAGDDARSPAEEVDDCLACHKRQSLEIKLETGEVLGLAIDPETYRKSSHGKKACSDCHVEMKDVLGEHAKKPLASKRAFAIAYSEACRKCHAENYRSTQHSVHRELIRNGNLAAAVCSDCHGAHDISSPGEPRTRISLTCGKCHGAVLQAYAKSVHGKALTDGNEDVPTCTDCHRTHDIKDARTGAFLISSPDICGTCHGNETLMAKYGISRNAYATYFSDFHGVTVRMKQGVAGEKPVVAVCTDCHGVHDIAKVTDPASKAMRANVLQTCRKCHPDAEKDFPSAWLSHYRPSPTTAPLVWLVKTAYAFFIPFMIGGLGLQLGFNLWRTRGRRHDQ